MELGCDLRDCADSAGIFDRYNIVSDQDLTEAVQKLQKFQDAAEPASQPPETECVPAVQSAFVN
jgi:hypothetical protein